MVKLYTTQQMMHLLHSASDAIVTFSLWQLSGEHVYTVHQHINRIVCYICGHGSLLWYNRPQQLQRLPLIGAMS